MAEITRETFTAAMEAAVAERGADWTYPEPTPKTPGYAGFQADDWHSGNWGACVYSTPDGTPACIIGLALHKIDPALVPEWDTVAPATSVLRDAGVTDYLLRVAARAAQREQDSGKTWGEALAVYRHVLQTGEEEEA